MESYFMWMIVLLSMIIALKLIQFYFQNGDESKEETLSDYTQNKSFRSFQIKFAFVFLTAMLSDWMTGAYLYSLYENHLGSNRKNEIALLFMIGFASSAIVSTFIGSIADKFGRKKICLLFCVLYGLCALIKHSDQYWALLIARFCGGFSTSILFSCFESWMISEHHIIGFKSNLLSSTFQIVWGLNSIIAIISGRISQTSHDLYKKYDIADNPAIAPFDLSAIFLGITFILILLCWKNENYGNSEVNITESLQNTFNILFKGKDFNAITLGLLSACFEGAMYLFVFAWTPTLKSMRNTLDEGNIFTVFMMGCLLGTTLNGCLKGIKSEIIVAVFCAICGAVMIGLRYIYGSTLDDDKLYDLTLTGFIIFEIGVGMYWPIIGGLRERYIPDHIRATVMNLFRIPLNLIVIIGLIFDDILQKNQFYLLGALLFIASGCALCLCCTHNKDKGQQDIVNDNGGMKEGEETNV